jgi:hypothetical protein
LPTERWEETSRREIGYDTHVAPRVGGVFAIVYEVTEVVRGKDGASLKWRERLVHGHTLYQGNECLIGTAALLGVVARGAEALAHIARAEDERLSAARHTTSRRKRR